VHKCSRIPMRPSKNPNLHQNPPKTHEKTSKLTKKSPNSLKSPQNSTKNTPKSYQNPTEAPKTQTTCELHKIHQNLTWPLPNLSNLTKTRPNPTKTRPKPDQHQLGHKNRSKHCEKQPNPAKNYLSWTTCLVFVDTNKNTSKNVFLTLKFGNR